LTSPVVFDNFQVDTNQVIALAGPGQKCEIENNKINRKTKSITAYFGALVVDR
jgi:hypothetical protein